MPLQRRLPKFGFTSRMAPFSAEVRLDEIDAALGDSDLYARAPDKAQALAKERGTFLGPIDG